jgi:hypothetical protein
MLPVFEYFVLSQENLYLNFKNISLIYSCCKEPILNFKISLYEGFAKYSDGNETKTEEKTFQKKREYIF